MLDDTLVVWCTEFGRTPHRDSQGGRAHHTEAFTCWLAGGGVKGGYVYGKTDEIGRDVVENTVFVHDFHATILHILGIDHEKLTYHFAGRDRRLTFGPGFTTQSNTTSNKTIVAASGPTVQ